MIKLRTPECRRIENVIRRELASPLELECRYDFDNKEYVVEWARQAEGGSHRTRFSKEAYADDRWKPWVRTVLQELNSD